MGKTVRAVLLAVAALPAIASATALAASGYSVRVKAASPVTTGHSFSVKARGVASHRALLYVYLDGKRCRSTWASEAQRLNITTYKSGQSYFVQRGRGPSKVSFAHAWVAGSFKKRFTGHAGTSAEDEYVCAYLTTPNRHGGYQVTAAHASARYAVTK
jgi:hypothetical protein